MSKYKQYSASQYKSGALNLLMAERQLLIKALIISDWNMKAAFELNFPKPSATLSGYNWLLLRHHISVSERSYKEISEIN